MSGDTNLLLQCYMSPLLQWVDTEKSEVSKADLKQIFLNIDVIISIHNELLKNLEVNVIFKTQPIIKHNRKLSQEKLNNWSESQILGDIFMRFVSSTPFV